MSEGARLDAELVRRGLARSRAHAQAAIAEDRVRVDGISATRASQRVAPDAEVRVVDQDRWVARSAHKLIAGLDAFGVDPAGRLCIDVGASTGGFTQVLLERRARQVIALDVGHGQLVAGLRSDPRVLVLEGVNARELDPGALARLSGTAEVPSLAVVDVSFISARLILPALASVLDPDGSALVLVKPQFEVGRTAVRSGLVPDRAARLDAVRAVLLSAGQGGWRPRGVIASPLPGTAGNREYLCALDRSGGTDPTEWERQLSVLD